MSEFNNIKSSGNVMGDNNINCNQNIYNADNFYDNRVFNNYIGNNGNNFSVLIKESLVQFENNLSSKNDYHYSSNIIPLIGRDKEIGELNKFLNLDSKLSIVAITADGGSGKSKLAYEFVKANGEDENKKDWDMFFVDSRTFFSDFEKVEVFDKITNNVLLVFDYILAYAYEIRNFLYILSRKQSKLVKKIRVILIERSSKDKNKNEILFSQEYDWYYKIIEKRKEGENALEDYFYKEIVLSNLNEEDYIEIAKKYIKNKYSKEVANYDNKKIIDTIINPFKNVDPNLKRVLYLIFSIDMVVGEKKNIYNKTELLNNIIKKEERRISTLLGDNSNKLLLSVKRILAYATAVGRLDLKKLAKNKSHFLYSDWEKICNEYNNDYASVINIFKTIFNNANETKNEVTLVKAIKPDLLGELFCIELLESERNNPNNIFNDIDYVNEFIQNAWREDSKGYLEFLLRIIEDYSEEKDIEYLMIEPEGNNIELKLIYIKLFYRLVYCYETEEKRNKIMEKLKEVYESNKENEEIILVYAKSIINLTCFQGEENCKRIVKKLKEVYDENKENEEVALYYAEGMYNLIYIQVKEGKENECKEMLKKLKEVYEKHKENEEIVWCYEKGSYNLRIKEIID